jgi:hypothetical protein
MVYWKHMLHISTYTMKFTWNVLKHYTWKQKKDYVTNGTSGRSSSAKLPVKCDVEMFRTAWYKDGETLKFTA